MLVLLSESHGALATKQNNVAVFIHVGKTGGSSARCMLKHELHPNVFCAERFSEEALGDGGATAIRVKAIAMLHMGHLKIVPSQPYIFNGTEIKKNEKKDIHAFLDAGHDMTVGRFVRTHFQIAIVSVRNPVERIASWFLFTKHFKEHRGMDKILFGPDCNYQSVGEFFSDVSVPTSPNSTQCQKVARSCVLGEFGCGMHNVYNYTYYLKDLFDDEGPSNLPSVQVFAIRNEHKWSDMATTNLILGGTAQSFSAKALDDFQALRQSPGDRSMSNETRLILCTLLCQDLYYYAKALRHAVNLHNIDKTESMKELSSSCGAEIGSVCPAYDFGFKN